MISFQENITYSNHSVVIGMAALGTVTAPDAVTIAVALVVPAVLIVLVALVLAAVPAVAIVVVAPVATIVRAAIIVVVALVAETIVPVVVVVEVDSSKKKSHPRCFAVPGSAIYMIQKVSLQLLLLLMKYTLHTRQAGHYT